MKRLITLLLIISILFVPSFVYAEGGKEMAITSTSKPRTYNGIEIPEGMSYEDAKKALNPGDAHAGLLDNLPAYEKPVNIDAYPTGARKYKSDTTLNYQALYNAQLEATLNALEKQRNSALSGLDVEKGVLTDTYYNKRNQAGAKSDIGALNFAQFMASRGVQGNAGAMPEIYRNAALQGQIGALDQQEAQGNADIEARRSQINSAYQNDVASARANTEAMALQAQIEQQRIDAANALEQSRYDATQANAADVTAYNRLQDTKNEYANTVSRFGDNYQAEIDKVTNDGDPSNDWQISILAAARQQKIRELEEIKAAESAAAAKAQQQQFENDLKMKRYNLDAQKTNYDINRPYSTGGEKTLTPLQQQTNTNNSKIAQMTNWIYNVPTNQEALQRLTQNKAMILQQLQEAGYDGSAALQYYQNMYSDLTSQ